MNHPDEQNWVERQAELAGKRVRWGDFFPALLARAGLSTPDRRLREFCRVLEERLALGHGAEFGAAPGQVRRAPRIVPAAGDDYPDFAPDRVFPGADLMAAAAIAGLDKPPAGLRALFNRDLNFAFRIALSRAPAAGPSLVRLDGPPASGCHGDFPDYGDKLVNWQSVLRRWAHIAARHPLHPAPGQHRDFFALLAKRHGEGKLPLWSYPHASAEELDTPGHPVLVRAADIAAAAWETGLGRRPGGPFWLPWNAHLGLEEALSAENDYAPFARNLAPINQPGWTPRLDGGLPAPGIGTRLKSRLKGARP